MAFTDLTVANGWIPVDYASDVLLKDVQAPVIEQVARIERMATDQRKVLRFAAAGVDVVDEGALIPLNTATLDNVLLDALKFANRFAFSSEDTEDSIVDAMAAARAAWLSNYAVKLDNACFGTTAAANAGTVPFDSVYRAVGAGNRQATAGALTFEHIKTAVSAMETNQKGNLVIVAHPSVKFLLNGLKDATGAFVVDPFTRLSGTAPSLFGHDLVFSYGAKTSATATDAPAGNPLIVVANKSNLILGVRSGPESQVSSQEQWANDNVELKMRARRAFVLAEADAGRVIEITAS